MLYRDGACPVCGLTVQQGHAPTSCKSDRASLLGTPLTTAEEATEYVRWSVALGIAYHYEESADQIGNTVNGEWVDLFTAEEAVLADARRDELFTLLPDPLGTLIDLDPITEG